MNHFKIIRVLTLWCHYINFAKSKYLNSFESQLPAAKKQKWFIFAAAHFTKLCKILLKNSKCFHWYLLNGKINLKNSNGSEFSIKITVGFQISMHFKKIQNNKIFVYLRNDRDISKNQKVLNSAYYEEQAVEVLQKSANFLFAGVKGLTLKKLFFRPWKKASWANFSPWRGFLRPKN